MNDQDLEEILKQIDLAFPSKKVDYTNIPFDSEKDEKDKCPKCGKKAEFVRTTLMCRKCNIVIGGF